MIVKVYEKTKQDIPSLDKANKLKSHNHLNKCQRKLRFLCSFNHIFLSILFKILSLSQKKA